MSATRGQIDGERIRSAARRLAFPRAAGSAGDRRVIELLAEQFRSAGLEVTVEPFSYDIRPAYRALRGLLVSVALLVGSAGALAGRSPALATAVLVTAMLAGGVFLGWSPWLERLYRGAGPIRTANVEGRRRVADPRLTLILMAHHDSKSQSLTLPYRIALTLVAILGALVLGLLLVGGELFAVPPAPPWLPAALGGGAAAALLTLSTLRSGNRSPGGVDNAGSLGILLELARQPGRELPDDVELIFLSPGAEEDHMVGAMRWLDLHLEELAGRPTWAINLDGAGIPGRVALLERFGFGRSFSPPLSRAARRAARRLQIPVRGVLLPPGMGVDAIPFVHRGVPCLTLATGSLGRAAMAVHSAVDRGDNLDAGALERVALLARELCLDLGGGAGGRGEAATSGSRR